MYKKILVINLMHIGDLLLTTPVLRTLRANFPQSHIALLADKKLADLVRLNENLDECLLIDKRATIITSQISCNLLKKFATNTLIW